MYKNFCLIGCVGLSGSGKSNSCLILEFFNVYNINADTIYNQILIKSNDLKLELIKCFNENKFFDKQKINKQEIINNVFITKYYLKCFNSIIKKYIFFDIINKIMVSKYLKKICVIDAPILFEYKLDKLCNFILLIKSKNNIRKKRLQIREPKKNFKYLKKRMQFQHKENYYFTKYNNFYYINNNFTNFELFLNLFFFIKKISFKQLHY